MAKRSQDFFRVHPLRSGIRLAVMAVAPIGSVHAQAPSRLYPFKIAGGSLQRALVVYAAQTGQQLFYPAALVAGRTTDGVAGSYGADTALARLLAGTGLVTREIRPDVRIIEGAHKAAVGDVGQGGTATPADALPPFVALLDPSPIAGAIGVATGGSSRPDDSQAIIVTGTHIRGRNPGAPPVTTITRADMLRDGHATVAQALQALPSNFGGTATEQTALTFSDKSGNNSALATGVNLRGLGANATLVLVNGQRLSGGGFQGDFTDVSSIPSVAVDRVEVLLDGASAIYGSDAVGGVVNIILKRPVNGAETTARLGSVTKGDKRDVQLAQSFGRRWATGGIMLAYEYNRTARLASSDRDYAASADSRAFGGSDHRYYFSLPGNILGSDPVTGSFGPLYAIPGGQNGTSLKPGDFLAGVTNLENFRAQTDLIPRQTRHSAYGVLTQDIGEGLHATVDARYSHRAFDARQFGAITIDEVTSANPFFVSPTGASSDLFAYSLGEELGPSRMHGAASSLATSASLDADLGSRWKLRSHVAFAREREHTVNDGLENDPAMQEALGTVPDDPATPFSTAIDGYFNPYGSGTSNSRTILDFVGSGYGVARIRTAVLSGHVDADGALFDLPAGPVKLAVGGDVRREHFAMTNSGNIVTGQPQLFSAISGSRVVEAAFAEVRVPLVGAANAIPGVQALDLSAAGRVEHDDSYGTSINPKIGLSWVPADGLTLRASFGTSFRAPNISELKNAQEVSTTFGALGDGSRIPIIQLSGGNPDLKPEKARSWTAGLDWRSPALPGLEISGTWFRTVFSRRIGAPANENFADALIDPTLASFVQFVTPATNAADLARVTALLDSSHFVGGNSFPATSVGAIVETDYVNTGKVDVSGVDLTVRYGFTLGANRFDLAANASYLIGYREQATPDSASVERLDRDGYPVDLRGRVSAGWSRGAWNATVGVNFVDHYRDALGNRIHAWAPVDAEIGFAPKGEGPFKGIELALIAQNLFDQAPPFYDSAVGVGYDAANSDALGRFVSLQITKRW
jgi:iron complex outermembrane receptor protein